MCNKYIHVYTCTVVDNKKSQSSILTLLCKALGDITVLHVCCPIVNKIFPHRYILYCTVVYSTVLYCTVLCCAVLYCTVLYCAVLHYTVLYCTVLIVLWLLSNSVIYNFHQIMLMNVFIH